MTTTHNRKSTPDAGVTGAVVIKRRFAVMLEDAIRVPPPTSEEMEACDGDLEAWARERYDALYSQAMERQENYGVGGPQLLWQDEHLADLDFPEVEYEVEKAKERA